MVKFLNWLYCSENGLMTQAAAIGTALSVACTVSNQAFDINAAYWAIMPLAAICHFARKSRDRRKSFAVAQIFH